MTAVNYLWDPVEQNIVREIDDTGAAIAQYTTEPGLYGDVLSQRRSAQDSYYHYDDLGSTLALTNANGDVTDTYAYAAFGEVTAKTGSTVNPFQYIGQKQYYRDEETGYEVRKRPLAADIGRWLSPIPVPLPLSQALGYTGKLINGYPYVCRNPGNAVDLSGSQIVIFVLTENSWDPNWDRDQWEDYLKAGGFPPGHFDDDRPPAYPKGPFPPDTKADPIAWGVELGDETHYPSKEEADDKKGKCICQQPTKQQSTTRPRGIEGEYPRPGHGEIKCELGKKVAMRYEGRCVPKDSPAFPKDCGDCASQICSRYVVWVCIEAKFTKINPFGTYWAVLTDHGFRNTKCKEKV